MSAPGSRPSFRPFGPARPPAKVAPRRRVGRGTLAVLAALLLASGGLRLASGAEGAIAAVAPAFDTLAVTAEGEDSCTPADTPEALLEAFRQREERIEARESQLADRMQALRLAEAEVAEKLAALQEAQSSLEATLALAATAAEDDITRLTAVYENMKPEDAAALFEQMAPDFAAGFLARMNAPAAAAVMTNLPPETAHALSVVIAGRNAAAPRE
ncbi:MotE family protein [Pseudoroseicyclus sp. CXY001]|uniref:MotE family protein n=1 Tax=Pseudoroseicyclus sp. CXY001 TaxID=3242492 RepID=UPI003570A6B2